MNNGFTVEELKKSIKNPFYEKLNRKVTVSVRHDDYDIILDAAKQNGEKTTPEDIMRRCLSDYAKILKEHE